MLRQFLIVLVGLVALGVVVWAIYGNLAVVVRATVP